MSVETKIPQHENLMERDATLTSLSTPEEIAEALSHGWEALGEVKLSGEGSVESINEMRRKQKLFGGNVVLNPNIEILSEDGSSTFKTEAFGFGIYGKTQDRQEPLDKAA